MSCYSLDSVEEASFSLIVDTFIKVSERNTIDFTRTGINFYTLGYILEKLGYEQVNTDINGWAMNICIDYEGTDLPPLSIVGSGLTFEIKLQK